MNVKHKEESIVESVRVIKSEIAAEHNYDVSSIIAAARRRQEDSGRKIIRRRTNNGEQVVERDAGHAPD